MALDPQTFLQTLEERIGFTNKDKHLLNLYADWGKQIAPEMSDHFYSYLNRDSEMSAILNAKEGRLHRLKDTFIQWFYEMFTGIDNWGVSYAERRWRIGLVHVQIGIAPQHVVPAMATVIYHVGKKLRTDGKDLELYDALSQICMIDLAFIEQAYVEVSSAAVLKETGWTEGLFRRLIATGANSIQGVNR
ncbi:MAG: hypothetical protein HC769_02775 [Cyanobacteria bacterium CRU_2_1]|nr:hypothetical protein [Cyanobacteria bacterium RU_5_0]NJR57867.1 hypothetical protein [Cyanobacteria bacterium CRU_2_1]